MGIWGCWGALKHCHKAVQDGRGGPVVPSAHPPLSHTDSTDFQESFVTSGVFSVTELIQVSRSECHCDATAQAPAAWAQQHPNTPPTPQWAGAPLPTGPP